MIPLSQPLLDGNEFQYVSDVVKSGWISSQGLHVRRFEELFSESIGIESVAVSSGTAALHLALKALGIGHGDEVILPDLTFSAVANAVIHCGARPILADVDKTWCLDPTDIEHRRNYRTKAIIAVHAFGHPCDMDAINKIAKKHGLKVIEDCAQAHGATYKNELVGTLADISCFSFFANKIMTTGEGGMVCTKDKYLSGMVRLLRDHGMKPRYWNEVAGFNYRMTAMQAAIGIAQIEKIDQLVSRKKEIGRRYIERLKDTSLTMPPDGVYWLFSVLTDNRDALEAKLVDIETRPFFYPLHIQPPYSRHGEFPVATELSKKGISLPSGNGISNEEIDYVCDVICIP